MDTQTTFIEQQANGLYTLDFDDDKIALMRRTFARGSSEDELALFVEQCRRTGLDPFARQIYSVRRKQWIAATRSYEDVQIIQVSIDGFRLIADRTHKYAGQVGPWWCGPDGEWKEVWLSDMPPSAARVGVMRHDFHQPLFAVALYKSYVQTNSNGDPISRWKTDPAGMLAKCAEALALRRAFPHELSGLYTTEEMDQADNPPNVTPVIPSSGRSVETPAIETTAGMEENEAEPVLQVEAVSERKGKAKSRSSRPYTPTELRANFTRAVAAIETRGLLLGPDDFAITQVSLQHLLENPRDLERYLEYVSGVPYLDDMNESQVVALLRLLKPVSVDGSWLPCEDAISEAASVIAHLDSGDS